MSTQMHVQILVCAVLSTGRITWAQECQGELCYPPAPAAVIPVDSDLDGIEDPFDNCPNENNYFQADSDGDMVGDACDRCPNELDPAQDDLDEDGLGDACDADLDGDGVANESDNCPAHANVRQNDFDEDGLGDACDPDDDDDGKPDVVDDCRLSGHATCDPDADGDGIVGAVDLCPFVAAAEHLDQDGDGLGDLCDPDRDGDTIFNWHDNCPDTYNPSQADFDRDGLGDNGRWDESSESCDPRECYVAGDRCLDPGAPFQIELFAIGHDTGEGFEVGWPISLAMFSNRLGRMHHFSGTVVRQPSSGDVELPHREGAGATGLHDPRVFGCAGWRAMFASDGMAYVSGSCVETTDLQLEPDVPGVFEVEVKAWLADNPGEVAHDRIEIMVAGEEEPGGCVAGRGSLLVALLPFLRRRHRR